jgi:hypothetical protein
VNADRVGHRHRLAVRQPGCGSARERSIGAAKREIAARDGRNDPVVVQERCAVEQLPIQLAAVERRERQPVQPCPIRVPGDRCRLLSARRFRLAREPRVRSDKRAYIDGASAGRPPAQREPGATEHVLNLPDRDGDQQPSPLARAETSAGVPCPRQSPEAVRVRRRNHRVGSLPGP